MRKLLSAALLLAGCSAQQPAEDGHTFVREEFVRSSLQVNITTYQNEFKLRAAYDAQPIKRTLRVDEKLYAFSVLYSDGSCTMHIIDPVVNYQPIWIGHEFTHCIRGRWHD